MRDVTITVTLQRFYSQLTFLLLFPKMKTESLMVVNGNATKTEELM